jgi:hypothetical protein
MPAEASAESKGDVATSTGTLTFTAGDTISGGYTYKSRCQNGPGSNPGQLIAAGAWQPDSRGQHRAGGGTERQTRADHQDQGASSGGAAARNHMNV